MLGLALLVAAMPQLVRVTVHLERFSSSHPLLHAGISFATTHECIRYDFHAYGASAHGYATTVSQRLTHLPGGRCARPGRWRGAPRSARSREIAAFEFSELRRPYLLGGTTADTTCDDSPSGAPAGRRRWTIGGRGTRVPG